jgi:hypothetical protein
LGRGIDDFDLGAGRLEAFVCVEGMGEVFMAIHTELDAPSREMRELEYDGYCRRPPRKDRYCLRPRSMREIDAMSVSAIRRVADELRPEWVEAVRDAARISNDTRWIAAWCEIRPEAVQAILANLKERGEIS